MKSFPKNPHLTSQKPEVGVEEPGGCYFSPSVCLILLISWGFRKHLGSSSKIGQFSTILIFFLNEFFLSLQLFRGVFFPLIHEG